MDDSRSFTAIAATHRARKQMRELALQEQKVAQEQRRIMAQQRRDQKWNSTNIYQQTRKTKHQSIKGNSEEGSFFDWSFWGLSICFLLMSIMRIRLEPSRRRARRLGSMSMSSINEQANVMITLRRINRGREQRGEPPISFDAYQALRMALLQDRTLLRGLAGHHVPPPSRGATHEQLQSCQQLTITENDDYDGDCCICLASYQPRDEVRILPCSHSYHKGCIDLWFEQSTLCPICKQSLNDGEDEV